jgi:hypothetical protein
MQEEQINRGNRKRRASPSRESMERETGTDLLPLAAEALTAVATASRTFLRNMETRRE